MKRGTLFADFSIIVAMTILFLMATNSEVIELVRTVVEVISGLVFAAALGHLFLSAGWDYTLDS